MPGTRSGRTSPLSWSSTLPPVLWRLLNDHCRGDLYLEVVAELPQLLRRPRVLEENTIDLEGIQFAGTVAVDGLPDAIDKCSQLCAVIVGNHGTSRLSLQLAGHTTEATQNRADEAVLRASAALGRPGY